jgi:hypothetical protein
MILMGGKKVARLRLFYTLILTGKSSYIVTFYQLLLQGKCGLRNNIIKDIHDFQGRFRLYILRAC